MLIGLIDGDIKRYGKKFPNLALMKISAYHKALGDVVEWVDYLQQKHYDKVYISKVFTYTQNIYPCFNADRVITGGTGFYINRTLRETVDRQYPDYGLYPECDYAIGFLTRGCINNCSFCVVPKKEGNIHPYGTWRQIKRHDSKKIVFMDNNVMACRYGVNQLRQMVGQDIRIDFNQGLDVTLVTEKMADLLAQLSWIKYIRFSCDKDYQMPCIEKAVKLLFERGIKPYRIFVYVLGTNFENTYKRIEFLRGLKVDPFLQPLIPIGKKQFKVDAQMKAYANYVNKKSVFNSVGWEQCDFNYWK